MEVEIAAVERRTGQGQLVALQGQAARVFQSVGVAVPPTVPKIDCAETAGAVRKRVGENPGATPSL